MSVRVILDRLVKGLEYKWVIIPVADHIGNDTPVVEVQNCTEIDLVDLDALIPFELRYIRKPLLVGSLGVKLPAQQVFSNILRISGTSGATMIAVFDRGFNIALSANPQNSFVVDMNAVVMEKIVTDAAISFVRTFCVNFLYFLRQLFIFSSSGTFSTGQPPIICCPGYLEQCTGCLYCRSVFSAMFLDRSVNMALPYLR